MSIKTDSCFSKGTGEPLTEYDTEYQDCMKTLKVLAILLSYPDTNVYKSVDGLVEVLKQESLLSKKTLKELSSFIEDYKNKDFLELQERFVATFDRSRAHCLNLFEHIQGESI